MFCTICGKEIENDSRFCPYCGAPAEPLEDENPAPEEEDTAEISEPAEKPVKKNTALIVIISIAVAAALVFATIAIVRSVREKQYAEDEYEYYDEYYDEDNDGGYGVPDDAVSFGGHYYLVVNEPLHWTSAKLTCEDRGGHLATITSKEEQNFIASLIEARGTKKNYWLGGTDENSEGDWYWITGETWNYTHWRSNQPDNGTISGDPDGHDYLEISAASTDSDRYMYWWDMSDSGMSSGYEGPPSYKDTQYHGYIIEWDD